MNARLVTFLYILMRDHLTPGTVESFMQSHVDKIEGKFELNNYTNKDLARYAVKLAKRIGKRNTQPSLKKQESARRAGKARLAKRAGTD